MQRLSIGDGFRFGCGLELAALTTLLAIAIIVGILAAIFGAAALSSILMPIRELGMVPQLIGLL